jgi:hypothetical protein
MARWFTIPTSESGGERQHVVLVVFCQEHYAMCTHVRTSPLNDSEKMEAGSEHADTSLTARETNCSGDAPNMMMPSMDLSQRSRKSDHWMGGMNPAMH